MFIRIHYDADEDCVCVRVFLDLLHPKNHNNTSTFGHFGEVRTFLLVPTTFKVGVQTRFRLGFHLLKPSQRHETCVCVCVYAPAGLGGAHGQQHVQSGPMFDGARPVLALPPRSHFGIQVLFGGHDSMLHRYVRSWAPPDYH